MMAPYAVGHLKMSFLLEELGYKLKEDDRFKLYLTNTLEMEELAESQLPGMASLSEESHLAGKVKQKQPILVILGNPPYSVSSANKSDFIEKEMDLYKEDVRSERNIQPLSDDYIKFIRFAHWKIEQAGSGIIGMITNNSYLSGLIHRGMRNKLLESFDKIYILNLHGNSRIGEKCPDGSKDENVFDIMQGVTIALFIKESKKYKPTKVFYQDIWGLREKKYKYLKESYVKTIDWKELKPEEPYCFFVEKHFEGKDEFEKFIHVTKIFANYGSGVKTNRDHFLTDLKRSTLERRIQNMIGISMDDDLLKKAYNLKDSPYWNTKREREKVRSNKNWINQFFKYAYRPFDTRWIYYQPNLIEIGRGGASKDVMCHFFRNNLGLALMRKPIPGKLTQVLVSENILDVNFYAYQTYLFPLYCYPVTDKKDLFSHMKELGEKESNINPDLFNVISEIYKKEPTSEEIFYYIYGVLYSNIYREKYAEFLKIDFPRVPFTKDNKLFSKMGEYGKRLVDLHLLKSKELDQPIAKFQGEGDARVEKYEYDKKEKRVYINKTQYFEVVPEEVWKYQIGGYQVCRKWLRDRKSADRTLSLEDIKHYCKIVTALQKTIQIQKEIDKIYPKVEKDVIKFGE
ncbi:hypothetical protein ES703_84346 [subsurface metagenome]